MHAGAGGDPTPGPIRLGPAAARTLGALAARFGGELRGSVDDSSPLERVVPVERAGAGDLAPLLASRFVKAARAAVERGARLLIAGEVSADVAGWVHPHAAWALADVLDMCSVHESPAVIGEGSVIGANAWLGPRVIIGRNVVIGANAVIGAPGFGWAIGPDGRARRIPQLGGVVIEDDVAIGPLSTIDAGTLAPTRIRRGAKLDAQCHVGHNCEIGEGTLIAAQSGFAGSVVVGRSVLVGGQVGVADHVRIGDGARIAAKSGVIGDVPPNAVVAGYPAIPRARWLRGLARLYRTRKQDAST